MYKREPFVLNPAFVLIIHCWSDKAGLYDLTLLLEDVIMNSLVRCIIYKEVGFLLSIVDARDG